MTRPKLTVVVPCLNEEQVIRDTGKILLEKLQEMEGKGSIASGSSLLFVDDHSNDGTWAAICAMARENRQVHGISLGRQSGQQTALFAGMMWARKRCQICISIDCDGQDDPAVMEQMVDAWRQGSQIVYGVRESREKDSLFKRASAERYYDFLAFLGVNIVKNHGDCRLLCREALDELAEYPESNLFLRGIIPLLGFEESCVYYARRERKAGKSSYTPGKMLALALDGITGFSIRPLRLAAVAGGGIFLGSLAGIFWALVRYLQGEVVSGWTSMVCILCFLGGMQLLCLGLLGEYLGKLYLEAKRRPRYRIAKRTEDGEGTENETAS